MNKCEELVARLLACPRFVRRRAHDSVHTYRVPVALMDEAAAALLALAEDGERYRWLRDHMHAQALTTVFALPIVWGVDYRGQEGTNMDAAIDAARQGSEPATRQEAVTEPRCTSASPSFCNRPDCPAHAYLHAPDWKPGQRAAAPDLYEALQEAVEFVRDHVDVVDGPYGEPQPNRAMNLLPTLEAALAKVDA